MMVKLAYLGDLRNRSNRKVSRVNEASRKPSSLKSLLRKFQSLEWKD